MLQIVDTGGVLLNVYGAGSVEFFSDKFIDVN